MTAVLLTAILVVALVCVLTMGGLVWAVRAHTRRQLDDARAQARRWVERLGGELFVLDSAAVRTAAVGPAGLAEASERFTSAGAELGAARTRQQCRLAQDTAIEGLHYVRSSRTALGLDAGPPVPGVGVAGTLRAVLADATSLPRLVDDVIAQARKRARQLPGGGIDPADWLRQGQQGWAHRRKMRH